MASAKKAAPVKLVRKPVRVRENTPPFVRYIEWLSSNRS